MHNKVTMHFALRLLKALDTPSSKAVALAIKEERWDDLVNFRFDPTKTYENLDIMRRDCLALEFLRKADFIPTTIDRAQTARDGFLASEKQCFRANRYLSRFLPKIGDLSQLAADSPVDEAYSKILSSARRWITRTLGPVPEKFQGRFGPGATFEKEFWEYRSVTHYDKLRNMPFRTENLSRELYDQIIGCTVLNECWPDCFSDDTNLVRGNRFTTVPKDATKDRGIAIEAGINVFCQLAVGSAIRNRLVRRGLDIKGTENPFAQYLNSIGANIDEARMGQDLHRRKAREASVSCQYCTVDLSSASDTICATLVELLLPKDWYSLLSQLRSTHTLFSPTGKKKDRRWYRLEKFSSMGNGFTFELETLIFASLLHAVGGKIGTDTWVYGDDIIAPDSLFREIKAVLEFSGFSLNPKKSFNGSEVRFRESCGGDFFEGHDIRPFYIKEEPHDPSDWISIANNLWNWSIKWSMPELMAVRNAALDNIPMDIRRCKGPSELGDLVIHDYPETWKPVYRRGIRYLRVWRPIARKLYLKRTGVQTVEVDFFGSSIKKITRRKVKTFEFSESTVALAAALMGLPSDGLAPRGGVSGYRFGRVAYS